MAGAIKKILSAVFCASCVFTAVSAVFAEETLIEGSNYTLTVENVSEFEVELSNETETDADWDGSYLTVHIMSAFARGEKGYYVRLGDFVYFCSFDQDKIVALCSRPDCFHDKETDKERRRECAAYVGYGEINNGLQYYDGKLYANVSSVYLETDDAAGSYVREYLYELQPDGSSRELLDYEMENAYSFAIHRGSIYYTSHGTDPDTLESSEAVHRIDMASEKETVIASLTSTDAVFRVYPYKNLVYIQIKLADEKESDLIIYDVDSDQAKLAQDNWNSSFFAADDGQLLECISTQDGLIAGYADGELEMTKVVGTLEIKDPAEYGFSDTADVTLSNWVSADESYLYVYGMIDYEYVTAIFDRETGKTVNVISMEGMPLYQYIGVDDSRIFYQCSEADGWDNEVYWLDKKSMLDEGAAFQKLVP